MDHLHLHVEFMVRVSEGNILLQEINLSIERYSRSPGAERLKRSFEVEGRFENEFVEGRATPGTSGARAGKRGKHAHATHHHHHHPPGQQ